MAREKTILAILAALMFTHIVDFMIMMPLGDQLMKLFDITPGEFSVLVSAYTITAAVTGFLGAFFIDRFDRKSALLVMYAGFTIGTLACAFSPTYEALLLARVLTGIFGGVIGALTFAIVGDIIPVERRSSAMGLLTASFSLASVIGVPLGLYLANSFDTWHAPFLMLGILCLIITVIVYFQIPSLRTHLENPMHRRSPGQVLKMLLEMKNQQVALLFMSLLVLGQFTMIPFITPYMIRNVGMSPEQIPLIYFVGGGLTMFTSPLVGKLADKHGRKRVFLLAAALSIIPLLVITNLPAVPVWVILVITGSFFVLISGRMIPSQSIMTSMVLPENRGSFMSLNSSVQQLGAGIASLIAGGIVDQSGKGALQHYEIVGYIAVACTLIAIAMTSKLKTIEGN